MNAITHQVLFYALFLLATLSGCLQESQPAESKDGNSLNEPSITLTVFAAASLADAFQEIAATFESMHPHVHVALNFAGSQQLTQQILFGAKADVFAPAHLSKIETVATAHLATPQSHRFFASNHLVVIAPEDNPAGVSSFNDLSNPGLKLVLAAKEVPIGQYTSEMLHNASQETIYTPNFQQLVFDQTVSFEQSVRAIRTKVMLGEADAGIVYSSDVYVSDTKYKLIKIEIPEAINIRTQYPITTLLNSQAPELARDFIDYVLSDNGQQILTKHGFVSV